MTSRPWGPVPPEVAIFNAEIESLTRDLPPVWEVGAPAARQAREAGKSVFGPLNMLAKATERSVSGPKGDILLRQVLPDDGIVHGVYLHIHGGGWTLGGAHHHDLMLSRMANDCHVAVVSVEYRLCPEHRWPSPADDCEAAARWLATNGNEEFGTSTLAIGGESAGAHLAVVTLLRLRDQGLDAFSAANLAYGSYDLRGTPSARQWGDRPLILTTPIIDWFTSQLQVEDLSDPAVSPLFANLTGLPPALFTVGTMDPLLDDSLFMHERWRAAGNRSKLEVWPGAIHAFDYFETPYAHAARRSMHRFLNQELGDRQARL